MESNYDILGTSRIQKFLDTYTDMRKYIPPGTYHIERTNALNNSLSYASKEDCWSYAVVIHGDYYGRPTINWNQVLQLKYNIIFYSEDNFLSMIPVTKNIITKDYTLENMLYGRSFEEVLMLLNMG